MHSIGLASTLYLALMLGLMPWMAFRSRRIMLGRAVDAAGTTTPVPTRTRIFASTLVSLALVFWLSWITGRAFDFHPFALPHFGARSVVAAIGAFETQIALMIVNRRFRSAAERRTMPVYKLMPRKPVEWMLYVSTAVAAGVAEETAYRGVLFSILWYGTGSPWVAVFVSATAFAASHALQGWKSTITIFLMALTMHALVWATDTLLLAMVVHAVYDIVAGYIGARRVARGEVEG